MKPTIAITAGDINGVGYEIILKSLINPHICEICRPIVYGNAKIARQYAKTLTEEFHNIQWNIIETPKQAKDGRLKRETSDYLNALAEKINKTHPDSLVLGCTHFSHLEGEIAARLACAITVSPARLGALALRDRLRRKSENEKEAGSGKSLYTE